MLWQMHCSLSDNLYIPPQDAWNGNTVENSCGDGLRLSITEGKDRDAQNSRYMVADVRAWNRALSRAEVLAVQQDEYERRLLLGDNVDNDPRDRAEEDCACLPGHYMRPPRESAEWEWSPPEDRYTFSSQVYAAGFAD